MPDLGNELEPAVATTEQAGIKTTPTHKVNENIDDAQAHEASQAKAHQAYESSHAGSAQASHHAHEPEYTNNGMAENIANGFDNAPIKHRA